MMQSAGKHPTGLPTSADKNTESTLTRDSSLDPGYRIIAWDGVSFQVPDMWELASYRWPKPGQTIIELEDDFSICLDGRWQWAKETKIMDSFRKSLEARDGDLAKRADHKERVETMPPNWSAFIYYFSQTVPHEDCTKLEVEKNQIFHATYLTTEFSASFQIQSSNYCPFSLKEIGEHFTSSFQLHTTPVVPWELFDISITMPREFSLRDAQIAIGSKHLIFAQKRRTLHLWVLSCADVILKDAESLEEWASGFLNSQGGIRSLVFKPGIGGLTWKRRFPMLITHRAEIGNRCFRWHVKTTHNHADNRILIWAYNYRRKADLEWLPDWLASNPELESQGAGKL